MSDSGQLSRVFVKMMEAYGFRERYLEARLRLEWKKMRKEHVSSEVTHLHLRGSTLYLRASSSVLRFQLLTQREELISRLNERLGIKLIQEIVLR